MNGSRRWTISIGKWGETPVAIHASLLAVLAVACYVAYLAQVYVSEGDPRLSRLVFVCIGVWLVAIVLHELAHWITARGYGMEFPAIVLGPTGNLITLPPSWHLRAELMVALAGAIPHLLLMAGAAVGLLALGRGPELFPALLHPLAPALLPPDPTWPELVFRVVFWVNWTLLVINLLPVWPFDGGRILQLILLLALPDLSHRSAEVRVTAFAYGIAVSLLLLAWFLRNPAEPMLVPPWLVLITLAGILFFHARFGAHPGRGTMSVADWPTDAAQEDDMFSMQPAHLEAAEDQFEQSEDPPVDQATWRRLERLERERAREIEEDRMLDEVLRRMHTVGLDGLSSDERALLRRVSARWRERRSRAEDADDRS